MTDYEEMEMPTPCQKCRNIFDLNDGDTSQRWYPNTIICENCGNKEDALIDCEAELEEAKESLANALFDVRLYTEEVEKLTTKLKTLDI